MSIKITSDSRQLFCIEFHGIQDLTTKLQTYPLLTVHKDIVDVTTLHSGNFHVKLNCTITFV